MELTNIIVLLFIVLCTVTADMFEFMPQQSVNLQKSAFNCATKCFDKAFPDAAYFTYVLTNNMCTCRDESEAVLFHQRILVLDELFSTENYYESNMEFCTKLCCELDTPENVESVSYIKADDSCYCHSVEDLPIFNIYGDTWEEIREWRNECLSQPGHLRYGFETGNFTCVLIFKIEQSQIIGEDRLLAVNQQNQVDY